MNGREKEEYLREYEQLKKKGYGSIADCRGKIKEL